MCKGAVAGAITFRTFEITDEQVHSKSVIDGEKNAAQLLVERVQRQLAARDAEMASGDIGLKDMHQAMPLMPQFLVSKRRRAKCFRPTLATIFEDLATEGGAALPNTLGECDPGASKSQSVTVGVAEESQESFDAMQTEEQDPLKVVFRGIPEDYTEDSLEELLDAEGFEGRYDLAYLSPDMTKAEGCNCATVIFSKPRYADRARKHFPSLTKRP